MYYNKYLEKCLKENKRKNVLLRGYILTKNKQCNDLIINDLGFMYSDKEKLQKFKEELIHAEIKEFILAESSSELMNDLHSLDSVGIKIKAIEKVKYIDKWDKKECFIPGIKMIVTKL